MAIMPIETRIAHLEGVVDQIGDRLNCFDMRFSNLERKVDVLGETLHARFGTFENSTNGRFAEMDRRFTWLIGLVIVSILTPIAQHFLLH